MPHDHKAKSRLLESVHEVAADLHRLGFIDENKMLKYDALCGSAAETEAAGGGALTEQFTPPLVRQFDLLATAPGGVARLRELILTLAVQGKLVPQEAGDEPASVLLQRIRAEKDRLIAAGKIRREKLIPDIREDERTTDTPNGWELVRLGTLIELISGQHLGPTEYVEGLASEIPYLTGPAEFGSISPEPTRSTVERRAVAIQGDILITVKGAGVGKLNIVLHSEIAISRQLMAIRPIGVDGKFLFIVLKSLGAKFLQQAIGIAIPGIGRDDVAFSVLGVPPLAEQSRIVTRVEELMRLCDALEHQRHLETAQHAQLLNTLLGTLTECTSPDELAANWQRVSDHFDLLLDRPEAVDALEQTILQLAVRGLLMPQDPADEPAKACLERIHNSRTSERLIAKAERVRLAAAMNDADRHTPLPGGWVWACVAEFAQSRLGKMLDKAKNTGNLYPYLRNTNVQWGRIDIDDVKLIRLDDHEVEEYRLQIGDLLVCEGGEPGRCAIWLNPSVEMYFQKALHRIRPEGGISPEFLAFCLEADAQSGRLAQQFTGATIKHFAGQELDKYAVALPPITEQTRIVARVTQLRDLCTTLRQRLAARQTTQRHLAEALVEV